MLLTIDVAIVVIATHVALHVAYVVVLWEIAVFLHVWAFVLGHRLD
jgi:hypothetical protein